MSCLADVSADARGFGPQEGPAAGTRWTSYNTGAAGGGHGGRGGRGSAGLQASYSFDSLYEPSQYGSGGGNGLGRRGGHGGGRIVFKVFEMLRLEGRVHADGEAGRGNDNAGAGGAGGAGGSIVIRTLNFDGEGSVTVNGGSGYSSSAPHAGGGAGGRIAVYYEGNYTFIGSFQSFGGAAAAERGGAGTVYVENRQNGTNPYRTLKVDNGVTSRGPSRLNEVEELIMTGNHVGDPYFTTSYQAPNGIVLDTTGIPFCQTVDPLNSNRCSSGSPHLANLFLSKSTKYYTAASSPEITYRFPVPLGLEYLLIYPTCNASFWTRYKVHIYLNERIIVGSNDWIDPIGCLQGQPSRMDVRLRADKVRSIYLLFSIM